MKMKGLVLGIFAAFILAVGIVGATPAGATITDVSNTTYSGTSAGSTTISHGYIYTKNLSATMQTMKWAAILGNVTGDIVLANSGGTALYTWSVDSITNGHVLATTNSGTPAWDNLAAGTASNVDSDWSFSGADNAVHTFTGTADDTINGISLSSVPEVKTNDGSSAYWETHLVTDSSSTAKDRHIFAGLIHDGHNSYEGNSVDFQVLVPVNATSGATDTYYMYVELE